jgi:hypothetical protein
MRWSLTNVGVPVDWVSVGLVLLLTGSFSW